MNPDAFLALTLIVSAFAGLLGIAGWASDRYLERKRRDWLHGCPPPHRSVMPRNEWRAWRRY